MRDYAKLAPTFWTGSTGKELRRRGSEAVIVALYLISSPHSNMLGLFYQPKLYMAHETGLGIEGASKGLQACIDAGFCAYDDDTEMVFVFEMAAWQIADDLKATDKRCHGVQKDYDRLPSNPFLAAWFQRYSGPFHLKRARALVFGEPQSEEAPSKGDTKPHRSQEQEHEQEHSEAIASGAGAPPDPADVIFGLGVPLLTAAGVADKPARSMLGLFRKQHADAVVIDALTRCASEKPLQPVPWLQAALKPRAGSHTGFASKDYREGIAADGTLV